MHVVNIPYAVKSLQETQKPMQITHMITEVFALIKKGTRL